MKKYIALAVLCLSSLCWVSCTDDPEPEDELLSNTLIGKEMPENLRADYYQYTSSMFFKQERPADAYWYPVYPGTDQWKKLWEEGIFNVQSVIRIPDERLHTMSSAGLLQSFLDYPFIGDVHTLISNYESTDYTYNVVAKSQFSFFLEEMQKRPDMGKVILQFMENYDITAKSSELYYYGLFYDIFNILMTPEKEFYCQLRDADKLLDLMCVMVKLQHAGESLKYQKEFVVALGVIFHDKLPELTELAQQLESPLKEEVLTYLNEHFAENWNLEEFFAEVTYEAPHIELSLSERTCLLGMIFYTLLTGEKL